MRTNYAPVLNGWLFIGLGAGLVLLRQLRTTAGSEERLALALVAAAFVVAGAAVVVLGFSQVVTFEPGSRRVIIVDRSRFGTGRRVLRFDQIREVRVESWTDPDPDARALEPVTHRVLLRLMDDTEVPLTDSSLDEGRAEAIRSQLARLLA